MMGDVIIAEYLRYDEVELNEESLRKARDELGENEDKRKECLKTLRRKLAEKEDLNPCLKDEFLLAYLRVAKFDCTKAFQRILRYYEERWSLPEIFKDYSPSSVKTVETARPAYACPYRNKDNGAVVIIKRGDYDPSKLNYDLIIRGLCMVGDMAMHHPLNQVCGVSFIMDLKTSAWGAWSEYTPSRMKLIARLVQKTVPIRIRKVHIINYPPIYYFIYSLIYPFLSAKMRNRIILHKNCESLHSYVEPENLPKEYGGTLETSDLINLFDRLYKMEDFFETFSKYGYTKKN